MSNYILDQYGRHIGRKGGSHENTLSNWVTNQVQRFTYESQNRLIADRTWDLYLNTSIGHGVLEDLITSTVGTGITPVFNSGMTDTATMTELWDKCNDDSRNFFDYSKRMSLRQLQGINLFSWKIDGIGVSQVIYSNKNKFSPSSVSLKVIDPYYLKTPTSKYNGDIYDGIEVNKKGQPVAIFIHTTNNEYTRYKLFDDQTGLPLFFLTCDVRNIYEYRQDSVLSCMMKDIKDVEESNDAVIVKFLISNLFTAFIKDSNFFNTYDGDPNDASLEDRTIEMEKGTIIHGAEGEEPVILGSSDQPGSQFEAMNKSIMQRLGIATGRGSEILKKEFNNSYSSARAALENATRVDNNDIATLNDRFNKPLAAWFTYDLLLRDVIPGDTDPSKLYDYSKATWIGQPRIEIDQLKSAKVDTERLKNGTTTYSQIWAAHGLRPKEQIKKIVEELKLIEEIEQREGVDLSFMKRGEQNVNELPHRTSTGNATNEGQ